MNRKPSYTAKRSACIRAGGSDSVLKITAFHRDAKAAIRSITGGLDLQRATTASAPYFKLPQALQTHLVRKMKRMYDEHQFGFDNSHAFRPRK